MRRNNINQMTNNKSVKDQYQKRYEDKEAPWDVGRPDFNLIEIVTKKPIPKGKVLDIGCGTGSDAIWLAQQGFSVTSIDIVEMAIEKAKEKAKKVNIKCTFLLADFLKEEMSGKPFDFVYDRGCFHSYDSSETRKKFASRVAHHLKEKGLWLNISGNTDEIVSNGSGPPRLSAKEIIEAVEDYFKILSLYSSHFGTNKPIAPRNWVCLMRKK